MENAAPEDPREEAPPLELIGRDEMNLAEFPIALLTDRVPQGQKTIRYEDRHGELTITGSDAYGLPTAADADVIVALIQLTKLRNNFTDPVVTFTRYELLKLLNWQDVGKSYRRLSESLNRWATVSLRYQGTWWDNRTKRNATVTMHILETVILYDRMETTNQGLPPLSSFTWNKTFLESCQANNLKSLDLSLYFSLKHPSSKRLYRFLDKRLFAIPDQSFELEELAFERVGLSRNYASNAGKIKEKLQPAIDELEALGFLEPMNRENRYRKKDRTWTVRFVRRIKVPERLFLPTAEPEPANEQPWLVTELTRRDVTRTTAEKMVQQYPAERIEQKIEVFDWLVGKQDRRVGKSPAGYLVRSITDDYASPQGFVSNAERQRQKEAQEAREYEAAKVRRQKEQMAASERDKQARIAAYRNSRTPEQIAQLEAEALAQADEEERRSYEDPLMAPVKRTLLFNLTEKHIWRLLQEQQETA